MEEQYQVLRKRRVWETKKNIYHISWNLNFLSFQRAVNGAKCSHQTPEVRRRRGASWLPASAAAAASIEAGRD